MDALNPQLLAALHARLGPGAIETGAAIGARHHADWSGHDACAPMALLRPRTTAEVASCLKLCHEYSQAVVVQGGLTGLASGVPAPAASA